MAAIRQVTFTDVCLNGQVVVGTVNRCRLYQREHRYFVIIELSDDIKLDLDVRKSLTAFNCSKWATGTEMNPIIDFTMTLGSLPAWMMPYSTSPKGCMQWLFITMKLSESRSAYLGFTSEIVSMLSALQCKKLDQTEALGLWEERNKRKSRSALKALTIRLAKFERFSSSDLKRLNANSEWLSDSHVTLCLLDSYQSYSQQNIWGKLKITLLDTVFWSRMSADPNLYHERYRARVDLVNYDFVVMPMFGSRHWRLGIVEKPGELLEGNTVFHILDSLPGLAGGKQDESRLQMILLKHFEGACFQEGRVTTNYAQVPRQPNEIDCGCFLIHFAQTFFSNPEWTLAQMKRSFSSSEDRLAAWELETDNLSFVRTDMKALLVKYIKQGDTTVDYVPIEKGAAVVKKRKKKTAVLQPKEVTAVA